MRVQYISDLHIEFLSIDEMYNLVAQIHPLCDVCVLAGDVGGPLKVDGLYSRFLQEMSYKFRKVFVIAGNHEFYGAHGMNLVRAGMRATCASMQNVSFLDDAWEDFEGRRWIGATLWSHVSNSQYTINDVIKIPGMDVERYNSLHADARAFLVEALVGAKSDGVPAVVITHHLPLNQLTAPQFRGEHFDKYHQWFSSDLGDIVTRFAPDIRGWFYGHTHAKSVQTLLGVAFYCNPVGYAGENDASRSSISEVCDV